MNKIPPLGIKLMRVYAENNVTTVSPSATDANRQVPQIRQVFEQPGSERI